MHFCEICEHFKRPTWKNICERLLLYFHYNSRHDYHHHHFHYHCKMQLYRLRIILTIPLDCCMIPCLFQLNFVFFFCHMLFQAFRFLRPVKGLRIRLRLPDKFVSFDVFFILIFVSGGICTSSFTFTYLYLFILMFYEYYYMNLITL